MSTSSFQPKLWTNNIPGIKFLGYQETKILEWQFKWLQWQFKILFINCSNFVKSTITGKHVQLLILYDQLSWGGGVHLPTSPGRHAPATLPFILQISEHKFKTLNM